MFGQFPAASNKAVSQKAHEKLKFYLHYEKKSVRDKRQVFSSLKKGIWTVLSQLIQWENKNAIVINNL